MKTREEWIATRLERWAEAVQLADSGEANEQVTRAVELVRDGFGNEAIAEIMGISKSWAQQLLADPLRKKARARKAKVFGVCADCGCRTYNSGSEPGPRCVDCEKVFAVECSRTYLIDSMLDWVERYGSPPSATDWNTGPTQLARLHPERVALIRQRHGDRPWPSVNAVQLRFGSWNAGLVAAGLDPIPVGHRRDPEAWRRHLPRKAAA